MKIKLIVMVITLILLNRVIYAQEIKGIKETESNPNIKSQATNQTIDKTITNPPPTKNVDFPEKAKLKTLSEIWFSISILVFGLIIILMEIFLIRRRTLNGENALKFVTITLIIISALFLIAAGYSNDQIAPAVGLLGTIAGY
jgi:hypothetical protein